MTSCIDIIEQHAPDAPKGSFYTCPHSRLYRLKAKGWRIVRNPWLKRSVKRQQWAAMQLELLKMTHHLVSETQQLRDIADAKGKHSIVNVSWTPDPDSDGYKVGVDPAGPEGFEVTRVVAKHDAKPGETINADFRKDPEYQEALKEWKASQAANVVTEVSVRETEDGGLEQDGPMVTTIEGHDISTVEQAEAVREFYQAEYQRLKHEGKAAGRCEYMVGRLDKFLGYQFGRIPVTKLDGTYLTEDEIRDAAAKLNLDVALDVSAGSAHPDVITTPDWTRVANPDEYAANLDIDPKNRPKAAGGVITDPPLPPGTISVQLSAGSYENREETAARIADAVIDQQIRYGL
ncbi:hypothetical protein SEA_COLUCCI_80 [Arthrobacter phage Colucci]|uniref:Uncharacterized protein n=1 Tax=Arthrobacter phage Colucci TaxID=2015834 RepID=A0A286N2Z2_9CAUD|nr:hypothetical protein FDI27_gp080 [Arthrobacter phage Colucci]ASX98749.1 hypothetical protein SEA_COLUCCI_80 [Arthrobacter phage Colucci]